MYLGSEAALLVLPQDPSPRTRAPKTGTRTFVMKLLPWGRLACLRAAVAATRLLITPRDESRASTRLLHLHLAEEYALAPSDGHDQALARLPRQRDSSRAKWRAAKLCGLVIQAHESYCQWRAKEAVTEVVGELGKEPQVRARIVAELLPWALGTFDPIERRVQERRGRAQPKG